MFGLTHRNRVRPGWSAAAADYVTAVGWSRDGRRLAAAPGTGPVALFDGATGKRAAAADHQGGALAAVWSPAADRLATAGRDGRVRLWDADGRPGTVLETAGGWVEHLAWRADGTALAAAAGRTVHVWAADGTSLADLTDHPSTVADVGWRPRSDTLAALVYGGVMLWTVRGTAAPSFRLFPWKGSPLRLAWSPDGGLLAHGNQDSTVHFWYAETAEELQMSGYPSKVRELSWDATGRYLATGGGPAVCVWDCGGSGPEGSRPAMLDGHHRDATLTAVAFQRAGRLLASAATDGRVCVWDPHDKKKPLVGAFDGPGEATAVAWSPDDGRLAAGFDGGDVTVLTVG